MYRTSLFGIVCSAFLLGCMTVQMPELSRSHPAHPEAESASSTARSNILQLREEPLIAPALPIHSGSRSITPSLDDHGAHSITGMELGSAMYVCPMHEEITSESPDTCSECGMDLVKKGGA